MKKKKKTENKKKTLLYFIKKNKIIIASIIFLIIILTITFLIINNNKNENNNEVNNNDNTTIDEITENDIVDTYNFTKEDAKNLVMQLFNSDNFEFNVTISSNAKYIVEVKNTINDNVYKYEVDPITKTYVEI